MPFTYNMLTTSQSDPIVSDNLLSAQLDFQRCHSYATFDGGLTHHDGQDQGQECATGIRDISIIEYTACTPAPSAAARAPAPLDLDWEFALDADSDSESESSPPCSLSPDEYPERASEPSVSGPSAAASATITTPSSTPCFSALSISSSSSSGMPPAGSSPDSPPPASEPPTAASTSDSAPRRQGRPHARSIHKKPRSYDLHDDFVHDAATAQVALISAHDEEPVNGQSSSAVETSEAQAPGPVAPSVSMPAYIRTAETKGFYTLAHRHSCPGFVTGHVASH